MAIIKKRDTTLLDQKNELRASIEENSKKLISETKPLEDLKKLYSEQYENELNNAKKRSRIPTFIFSSIISAISIAFLYNFFNSKFIALAIGVPIFFAAKEGFSFKVLEKVRQNENLGKVQNEIFAIKHKYNNENYSLKSKLDKIEKGFYGEYEVARLIEEKLSDRFVLLNDITIPTPSGTTQIDHVLITPKRIICIETKSSEGIYYPNKNGWMWYPTNRQRYGKTAKGCLQDNPINQATYHSRKLYNFLLSKKAEYKVDAIVVLSNSYSEYRGPKGYCPVLSISELVECLKTDDNGEAHINRDTLNKLSEFLVQTDDQFSELHYEKYNKKVLVNI